MRFLRNITKSLLGIEDAPQGKHDCRAYGVGDVHGRLDLLDAILGKIDQDIASRPPKKNFIVFLGDLIDRGPASAQVVERLRTYRPQSGNPIFLFGNHEEVLLRILRGDRHVLPSWLKFGGAECARSYGLDPIMLGGIEERQAIQLVQHHVPAAHREFLEGFSDTFRFGDYLFVHAGIRPGIPLEEQDTADLRWIREPFLTDRRAHGLMVVHGHTIVDAVEMRSNRIAIDTGAYRTGILSTLVIEDQRRWVLSTATRGETPRQNESLVETSAT